MESGVSEAGRARSRGGSPGRAHRRPPVVVVGDGVVPTGFARVLHSILGRLHERYELHHLAINYQGEPHGHPWSIYAPGAVGLRELVERVRPRLVFLLNDLWLLGGYLDELRAAARRRRAPAPPVVAYSPVDAGPLEPEMLAPLAALDRLVLYTRFGRAEVRAGLAHLRRLRRVGDFPRLSIIPHGVDADLFRPLVAGAAGRSASRAAARRELFGDPALHDGGIWIVLNANRNQPRKRIDITIKGFALFARDKPPGVRLYLHMGLVDCGWDVVALARRHGIEDRLIVTAEERYLPGVPDEVLNRIYNACDVGINTSLGEGWGLVNLEHAATGAAQVVPRHSACAEIWEGAAELMEPTLSITQEGILTEGHLIAPEEVAAALGRLYADPSLLARRAAAAYAVATRPGYRWDAIARRWDALFQEALAARAARRRAPSL